MGDVVRMKDSIASFYDAQIVAYGATPQGVDAASQASLDVRYEVLSSVCDMNNKKVLEVGCSFGGLGRYLKAKYPDINYVGIDISAKAIELGKTENPDLDLRLCSLDNHIGKYDVVLAQGIFYKLDNHDQVFPMVEQMLALAGKAVAFSAIDTWGNGNEMRMDSIAMCRWFGMGSMPFAMRCDYKKGDTTFYLYRGR